MQKNGPEPDAEDLARAEHYALLARLYYAAPDAELLNALAGTAAEARAAASTPIEAAWHRLANAAAAMDVEAALDEYDSVFVGTGKAEITLYASHYLSQAAPERVLVKLRAELASMRLGRRSGAAEPEDHIAALCDVMRYLISHDGNDGEKDAALQQQKQFFVEYISPWYADFCVSVAASRKTNFYRHVATFAKVFFDVEAEAFELA
jgi:TorA maturation chaperone TorD